MCGTLVDIDDGSSSGAVEPDTTGSSTIGGPLAGHGTTSDTNVTITNTHPLDGAEEDIKLEAAPLESSSSTPLTTENDSTTPTTENNLATPTSPKGGSIEKQVEKVANNEETENLVEQASALDETAVLVDTAAVIENEETESPAEERLLETNQEQVVGDDLADVTLTPSGGKGNYDVQLTLSEKLSEATQSNIRRLR